MNIYPDAKRILAFGDSITWGRAPGDDNNARYPVNIRWAGRLQELLGNDFEIIEEGLNGRTTDHESPNKAGKNGRKYLYPCLESQKPLDLIILALGINDLKAKYALTPEDIGKGLENCVETIKAEGRTKAGSIPKVIIVSPAIVIEKERVRFGKVEIDFLGANEKSKKLSRIFSKIAQVNGFEFLDLATIVNSSDIDGVHIDPGGHEIIANHMFQCVKPLFPQT